MHLSKIETLLVIRSIKSSVFISSSSISLVRMGDGRIFSACATYPSSGAFAGPINFRIGPDILLTAPLCPYRGEDESILREQPNSIHLISQVHIYEKFSVYSASMMS